MNFKASLLIPLLSAATLAESPVLGIAPLAQVQPKTQVDRPAGPITFGPAVRPQAVAAYVRMTDPLEQAFTVEVPSGWRSEGALVRLGPIGINPFIRSLSPDKMTYLMGGEPGLPSFAPPSEVGLRLGFREGTLYNAGLGQQILILHYLSGAEFARAYGQSVLGNLCPDLKFVSAQDRPDLARQSDTKLPTVIPSRSTGGEAVFTCTHNKREMIAQVEAATRITRDNIGWGVTLLQAFLAPKAQGAEAHSILLHIIDSTQWSPAWVQMQNRLSQQAADSIRQRIAAQERQQAAFVQKLNGVDRNFQEMDELINGSSHYRDESTGQEYDLNNLNPFKWKDVTGRIFGTATNAPPPFAYGPQPLRHVFQ